MATVIDELLVTLGLDSTKFKTEASQTQATINRVGEGARKQSSELEDSLKKHQTETTKRLKQVGEVGQNTYNQFNKLRLEVMALFSTLATGYGIQQFIKNVTTTELGLGRVSAAIGNISVQETDAFGQAVERMGGDAKQAQAELLGFSQALEQQKATGVPAPFLQYLRKMHIDLSDAHNHAKPIMTIMDEMSKWFSENKGPDATFFGSQLGFSLGTVDPMSRPGWQQSLEKARKTATTSDDVKKGEEFVESLADIEHALRRLGQTIVNDYVKDIKQVLDGMTDWIGTHPKLKDSIEVSITAAIKFIKDFLAVVDDVVKAVGGWQTAIEIVFGLWAVAKVAPILTAIGSITSAMIGLGAETTLVGGLIGGIPLAIAAVAGGLAGLVFGDEWIKKHNQEHPEDPIETMHDRMMGLWNGTKNFFGSHFGGASDERQADVRDQLSQRLGISGAAASGLVSNLNAESGIQGINEANPTSGRGGFGWAQWTGPRRNEFESYTAGHHLDPASDDANMGFLVEELTTKYPAILAQLRRGGISPYEAADIVARGYIIPPADKVSGHIAGASGIAVLPSPAHTSPIMGAPRRPAFDPAFSDFMRNPPAAAAISNDNSRSSNQHSEVHTGPISIHVANGDADSIARGVGSSLRKYAFVSTANVGLA